jgi:Uncharacterized protein conserved in bacteria
MNKYDYILAGFLLIVSIILCIPNIQSQNNKKEAFVYYENKEILKIDLSNDKNYTVKGYNGKIVIEVKNKKLRIIKETSPLNICSKMGYISASGQTLVCLPNKVIVSIKSKENIDGVVK